MPNHIAFISATWHQEIIAVCRTAFLQNVAASRPEIQVDQYTVPGCLEMPHLSQLLANSGKYVVIICSGFIVDGGIYRHDFVARAVIDGIVQVSLKTNVPVLSAILTPHHFHEHETHQQFFSTHMLAKGQELAKACLHTLANLEAVQKLS
jgi:6,7-dimethyl-8-ribityllumazine synthase